ncbi:hypothetical protein BO70DRAFT_419069 [Aspergillus heteromorphus CBS 117.55]|uniref:MFS general substrate transporter n=1 Tax=Aspergillus heteromorphus CBS 117.55 TaxID=1448321 RepID=A0A317V1W8_9EURO|nr:uncharacterized protein BO70DRAFT_419069 [Aspergillus heteromorphus CBS 117.55]PWY66752.1 hypothetical protein BO70DRAFT_419069 [Aspergillus heteromorphus CBS 117.55]
MAELLKTDWGESGFQTQVNAAHSPDSEQVSEKNWVSSDDGQSASKDVFVRSIAGFKWILVVTAILSSRMLFALDNTIVANIQPGSASPDRHSTGEGEEYRLGGSDWPWGGDCSIALFVVAGILFIVFGVQQTFHICCNEKNRLFPIHFLKRRSLPILFILNTCASSGLFISVYKIPLFFQFTMGDTAIKASLRLLPFVLVLIFIIIMNGHMMTKFGYYLPWYVFGCTLELIAAALVCKPPIPLHDPLFGGILNNFVSVVVKTGTSASAIYGYTSLMALGVGAFNQAGYSVVQAKVKTSEIPWALGFMMVSQLGGIVIGLGTAGAIFVNEATEGLLKLLPEVDPEVVKNAIAGTSSSLFDTLTIDERAKALDVIVHAINQVYILLITAGAMGVVLSVFLKSEKLFLEVAAGGA